MKSKKKPQPETGGRFIRHPKTGKLTADKPVKKADTAPEKDTEDTKS